MEELITLYVVVALICCGAFLYAILHEKPSPKEHTCAMCGKSSEDTVCLRMLGAKRFCKQCAQDIKDWSL